MSEKSDHSKRDSIHILKKELRARSLEKRKTLAKQRAFVSEEICQNVLDSITFTQNPSPAVISGYWPLDDEIDIKPLLKELFRQGHPLGLPVVVSKGRPLSFRSWTPEDPLVPAGYGLQVPVPEAEEVFPKFLLTPLLAFDRKGYRLGYGGGFYDRTLEFLRSHGDVCAIGVVYSELEVDEVPTNSYDQPLDYIITEKECLSFKRDLQD